MELDHLSDGTIAELDYAPQAGDEIAPDFGGAAAAIGIIPTPDPDINPKADQGIATWHAWRDNDGSPVNVDNPCLYGAADYSMNYGVCYLDVKHPIDILFATGSDDAVQVILDGASIWTNPAAGGWIGFADLPPVQTLHPGVHQLMVKVFEGVSGYNFGVQLQDGFGLPMIPDPDVLQLSLDPEGYGGCVGPQCPCAGADCGVFMRGDSNRDGRANIADAVYLLQNLFAQGPAIPAPHPICGADTTPHPGGGPDLPACAYDPELCNGQ